MNAETCLLDEVDTTNTACRTKRHAVSYLILELRDTGSLGLAQSCMHAFHIATLRESREF